MLKSAVMLACDLLMIIAAFGLAGYYYSANQMSAGEWYMLQYDVETLATNINTAAAIDGYVEMSMTVPPYSYISVYNDDLSLPSYGTVVGVKVSSQRSMEWLVFNTIIEGSRRYNQLGYVMGPVTRGTASVFQAIFVEKTTVSHTQISSPAYSTIIDNTYGDESQVFDITLDGTGKYLHSGDDYVYPIVSMEVTAV